MVWHENVPQVKMIQEQNHLIHEIHHTMHPVQIAEEKDTKAVSSLGSKLRKAAFLGAHTAKLEAAKKSTVRNRMVRGISKAIQEVPASFVAVPRS